MAGNRRLKQLPAQTFGILMSMEPVLAALSGIIFLGEQLNVAQWVALACIIVAPSAQSLTIRRKADAAGILKEKAMKLPKKQAAVVRAALEEWRASGFWTKKPANGFSTT